MHIIRRFEWDAAHRLPDHEGLCSNIHGHRYKAEIQLEGEITRCTGSLNGMVVDFGALKTVLGGWIKTHWDHACLLSVDDDHPAVKAIREAEDMRVYLFDLSPTVEVLTEHLAKVVEELMALNIALNDLKVTAVRIWETPNCSAVWTKGS